MGNPSISATLVETSEEENEDDYNDIQEECEYESDLKDCYITIIFVIGVGSDVLV